MLDSWGSEEVADVCDGVASVFEVCVAVGAAEVCVGVC